MGSHSITCHPAEVIFPPLPPAEAGTRLSDPGGMQGWVDLVVWRARFANVVVITGLSLSLLSLPETLSTYSLLRRSCHLFPSCLQAVGCFSQMTDVFFCGRPKWQHVLAVVQYELYYLAGLSLSSVNPFHSFCLLQCNTRQGSHRPQNTPLLLPSGKLL